MGIVGREAEAASLRNLGLVCLAAFGLAACTTDEFERFKRALLLDVERRS